MQSLYCMFNRKNRKRSNSSNLNLKTSLVRVCQVIGWISYSGNDWLHSADKLIIFTSWLKREAFLNMIVFHSYNLNARHLNNGEKIVFISPQSLIYGMLPIVEDEKNSCKNRCAIESLYTSNFIDLKYCREQGYNQIMCWNWIH